jgi:hypothetical protein
MKGLLLSFDPQTTKRMAGSPIKVKVPRQGRPIPWLAPLKSMGYALHLAAVKGSSHPSVSRASRLAAPQVTCRP